jgi:hypothetical protein
MIMFSGALVCGEDVPTSADAYGGDFGSPSMFGRPLVFFGHRIGILFVLSCDGSRMDGFDGKGSRSRRGGGRWNRRLRVVSS